jgi:HEAT repeat protein
MFYWITKIVGELKAEEGIEPLINFLEKNRDSAKREAIIRTLGNIGNDRCIEYLIGKLSDDSWTMRKYAAESLLLSGKSIVPKMMEVYRSDNPDVRYWAVWVIGKLYSDDYGKFLKNTLKDGEWFVRSLGVSYIGDLKLYEFISDIIPLLEDENSEVRKASNITIEKLKSPKSIPYLEKFISENIGNSAEVAKNILESIEKYEG